MSISILCIVGPTASGKSGRAVEEALRRNGEVISVDSRQVYCGLDIGTEKISVTEMQGVPHHLINIREPQKPYSAGDFVQDATQLIKEITARGKLPILVGGTHFYFNSLLNGLPASVGTDPESREALEKLSIGTLYERIQRTDPERAATIDPKNKRRLVRALEIIDALGKVPQTIPQPSPYEIEWIVIDPPREELIPRIETRLRMAFDNGLIAEVLRVRELVGDERLNELGLEYRIVDEYLRRERDESSLFPALSTKLWHYARAQKKWLRKLRKEKTIAATPLLPDRN